MSTADSATTPAPTPPTTTEPTPTPAAPVPKRGKKRRREEDPIPPPQEGHCHFYVKRKQRYCRLDVKKGRSYCGEHAVFDEKGVEERVPCPYDGNHTITKADLQRHLERCNRKPKPKPPYYVENINVPTLTTPPNPAQQPNDDLPVPPSSSSSKTPATTNTSTTSAEASSNPASKTTPRERLVAMPPEEFAKLVEKIRRIYAECLPGGKDFRTEVLTHSVMDPMLVDGGHNTVCGKHGTQQASLIGHLDRLGLTDKDSVFIEFGCGKGQLSNFVHMAVGDPSTFILVDRRNFRMKIDRFLKVMGPESTWRRLMIDIKDLDLSRVDDVKGHSVVAVSKHLCGSATDITLKCLTQFLENDSTGKVKGLVIALCCHQICKYSMYINHGFLEKYGITEDEFAFMCVMSTWATCGQQPTDADEDGKEKQENKDVNGEEEEEEEGEEEGHTREGMDSADQTEG
ncbi:tRNA:m(4)X modification enzyme TRM13 [Quaeritorhiza haematococci]|nr:tRNA:m(4)X modification enzyme TRM13 [Quaeritorhiza haematococci]